MTDNTATQRRTTTISSEAAAASSSGNSPRTSATSGITNNSSNSSTASAMMLPLRILSIAPKIVSILLRVLFWPLFKIANMAFPPKEYDGINNSPASDRAARAFVSMFQKHISVVRPVAVAALGEGTNGENNNQEHYVEPACPFSPRGYNATLSEITGRPPNTRPLLLLYLHSPLHANGTNFLRNYLCHSQLLQLLNSNNSDSHGSVVCFGASVHTADGQKMRDMLGVTSFPFMALLSVKGSSNNNNNNNNNDNNNNVTMELLLRMEGPQLLTIPPTQITTYLNTSISRHAEILAAEEARRLMREEEQRLRQEQDREYQEALLADQMREIELQEAAERERREQEEKEEVERTKKAKEESRLDDARALMENTGGEPIAGSKGVSRLRFTLPNGKKVDRRFRSVDLIETIRAFLVVYFDEQGIEMKNFGLSTNFPRRSFKEEGDNKLTLEEAGLAPQAVIMVQDLDA
ncbi:hypothetical protein ACHAXR_008468 [Thalassiosira sp. AJA248-18]